MMKFLGVTAIVLSATAMAGCTNKDKLVAYDGEYFRAKAKKVDKQRDMFVVTVKGASKSINGARQAAYHNGVSYCIDAFGSSDIVWAQDPLDEDASMQIVDDVLIVQGRCPQAQKI